jgi:DNA-binding response OmpR family regulator
MRVALIEDDETVNRTLRRTLNKRDYDVTCLAVDAVQLDKLLDEQLQSAYEFHVFPLFWDGVAVLPAGVDVVVSDYKLNGHKLLEVLSVLRASAGVVAITGSMSAELVKQLVAAGIDAYMRKPYQGGEELVAAIEIAARAHQTRERGRALARRFAESIRADRTWRQAELEAALVEFQRFAGEEW